jgi:microcystin-dependent protein
MPDDRVVEEPVDQVARLQRELDDFKTVLTSRLGRRPTGDIEETIRATPKQNTLICNGQTVNRSDYAALWQWAQDNTLVTGGKLFTAGNGTTTFTVPDFRGVIFRGMAAGEVIGQVVGADSRAIAIANLPAHDHNVSASADSGGTHDHSVGDIYSCSINDAHGHAGSGAANGPHSTGSVTGAPDIYAHSNGIHGHGITVNESLVGSGTAFDTRQASFAGNYLIWI